MKSSPNSIVLIGSTGAVGSEVLKALLAMPRVIEITTLSRRNVATPAHDPRHSHVVDMLDPQSYRQFVKGQQAAVCTLGVGQPSTMSHEEFARIDRDAVITFAKICKEAGVSHFQVLSSVAANAGSNNRYLRTKGQLQAALVALDFERLSIFQPSMILTPTNRYGWVQGLTLKVWPTLSHLLLGRFSKYRGITARNLGLAMVRNLFVGGPQVEVLHWQEFSSLARLPHRQSTMENSGLRVLND